MNKGFKENFKQEFPNLIASSRLELLSFLIPFNLHWLLGFIEAEGSFICLVRKNPSHKIGYQVKFTLAQESRNLALITKLTEILGLGLINQTSSMVLYTITRKYEIDNLVPMVEGGLKGTKALAIRGFLQIQGIINKSLHITEEGLALIKKIKMIMNKLQNEEKETH
jgi:hypothetical protein